MRLEIIPAEIVSEPNTGENALKHFTFCFAVSCVVLLQVAAGLADEADKAIQSAVKTEANGDIFLIQEVTMNAPVKKVWAAYATAEGWESWATPVASVDLNIGGTIRTNYRKEGKTTDDDAVVLHIINYVPERVLTLQAELGPHFPAALTEREKQMYNLITFHSLGENRSKIVSYGIGYKDTPEMQKLLKFFISSNEQTYERLIKYVETGEASPVEIP